MEDLDKTSSRMSTECKAVMHMFTHSSLKHSKSSDSKLTRCASQIISSVPLSSQKHSNTFKGKQKKDRPKKPKAI